MNEDLIRKIAKEEANKAIASNFSSGTPIIPPHRHNGIDNLQINGTDILHPTAVMGKINFTSNATYTLYFSHPNPSRLDLNGFAYDTGATDSSALVVGVAILSKAYYFQPLTTRSAKEGGLQYPTTQATSTAAAGALAQCSSNLYVQDAVGTANTFPHTEQFYIMNAFSSSGNHLATAEVRNLTNTSIDIVITNLLSGWNVSANFIIT